MKKKLYIAPQFDRLEVYLLEDVLSVSNMPPQAEEVVPEVTAPIEW